MESVLASGEIHGLANHTVLIARDGTERPIADSAAPIRDRTGTVIGVVLVFRDVTDERRAQLEIERINASLEQRVRERTAELEQSSRALRDSEERFRQLAEQSSEGFWFVEVNPTRVLYVSPAIERIWGQPAERFYQDSGTWFTAIQSDDQPRVHAALEAVIQGKSPRFETEYRVTRSDGSARWVWESGIPIRNDAGDIVRLCGVVRDITEKKQAEGQLLRAQRLESIGTLASGVAHDLNNMLAPIMMSAELIRLEFPGKASAYLDMIQSGAQRGADLVKQLLTFAKGGAEGEFLPLQPRHLQKDVENLIVTSFPKNIEIQCNCANDLHAIRGEPTQLHQVLLNLCVNARDAMPAGGKLTVTVENADMDAAAAKSIPEAEPGRYVVWRIEDTGIGIPQQVLDRIFEPFFTTKGPDKGTGLGLSTVIGIVKGHGGFVRVDSEPGKGTTFAVYLPAVGADTEDTPAPAKLETAFRGNRETILVVDDDPGVREVTRAFLKALNFRVLTAPDGTAALLQVAEHRKKLGGVISDCHMPNMDGLAFIRILRARLPETGIIVASGRLEDAERSEFRKMGVDALLDKPFTQEKLVEALRVIFHQ